VTHDLAVVAQMADRVAVMKDGAVVEQGDTQEILRRPSHVYTQTLLADAAPPPKTRSAAAASETLLEGRGIVRNYARVDGPFGRRFVRRAVDDVSLRIGRGESLGLVGESGSGKSTLLRTLLALEAPQSGEVQFDGVRFDSARGRTLRQLRRRIQAVFQDPYGSFDPRQRVEDLVAEPFHLSDNPPRGRERRARVEEMLTSVGLQPSDADRFPHTFSGGERQRIAIARALITEPDIVALDEAVSALDVTKRAQILVLLNDLLERFGLSYLFVSHDLHVVRAVTDRVLVMQAGRIVEEGPTEEVFAAPKHPYTAALIAATPTLETQ
jgi:peptide/nickel transport system ATP-binding protein